MPNNGFIIEKEWTTNAGLRAMVGITCFGEQKHHRCGYVEVPNGHIAHGKDYTDDIVADIDVHGGLTFARTKVYNHENENGWWFGYDCAHWGDGDIEPSPYGLSSNVYQAARSQEYCELECEHLATQLSALTPKESDNGN